MILVDKDIKTKVNNGELITEGYQEENVNSISYDLTIDSIIIEKDKESIQKELLPGEMVYVKTREKIKISKDVLGRIAEKNSLMRIGLRVEGPTYQPGHETYAFLRIQNISNNIITITKSQKIAQIIFEKLSQIPEMTYDRQQGASFNNEVEYVGAGAYEEEYNKNIKSYEDAKEQLENAKDKIYANVLTLMGILVGIFSIISVNYQVFTNMKLTIAKILTINFSLAFSISFIFGLIYLMVERQRKKNFIMTYVILLIALLVLTCVSYFVF